MSARLPPDAFHAGDGLTRLLDALNGAGERAMVVGGAVRNALLGQAPGDIDIAATAEPQEVTARARRAGFHVIPTGIDHGTVTALADHRSFEITTLREDVATDGRRATVRFGRDFAQDAARRDFTINALYADQDGRVHDFVGGLDDLAARRVRFIGDARTRIREDYLRILRLFRFHAQFSEGPLDPAAFEAALAERAGLARLSRERVGGEILKLLMARGAARVIETIAEAGFLTALLGIVPDTRAFAAAALAGAEPMARLAALAVRVAEDAALIGDALRLSKAQIARLETIGDVLPALHDRLDRLDPPALRALAWRVGAEMLCQALAIVATREGVTPDRLAWLQSIARAPLPPLRWSGAALVADGMAPGPDVGAVLRRAETLWIAADFPRGSDAQAAILARAKAMANEEPDRGGNDSPSSA